MIRVGDKVVSQPGTGQPKVTGTVVEIRRDRALIQVNRATQRWRSLRHLTKVP